MSQSLASLESRRSELLRSIGGLNDMRPGSIVGAVWRCGKPNCHCARADDPGHGPNLRLTYKSGGKTVTEALPTPAAVRKAEQEIAEFRSYQKLGHELVVVSEQICRLRPVEGTLTLAQEVSRLLQVVFAGSRKTGQVDLEAVEMLVRESMHRAGAAALERLLSRPTRQPPKVSCGCGHTAQYHDQRNKQLLTVLGPVQLQRSYYVCPQCHQGKIPRDEELDVVGTECSPGVQRMMAAVGSDASFHHGREQLALLAGLEVTTKAVERHAEAIGTDIARREQDQVNRALQLDLPQILGAPVPVMYIELDGTQVPMVRAELEGRGGRIEGQPARTREVKLGCVFTQTTTDEKGRPIRDEVSTTYTGAIEAAELFGRRLYTEAWERGWNCARKKVVLGDGAEWIWNIADQHFPGALQVVDIWHAREHLWDVAAKLFPSDDPQRRNWAKKLIKKLNRGRVQTVVIDLRAFPTRKPALRDILRTEADYFERNQERMRYPKYRKQGLFFGSGVIEAGCKTVIGSRLNSSSLACSGLCAAPTPSSHYAAIVSAASSKTTGRLDHALPESPIFMSRTPLEASRAVVNKSSCPVLLIRDLSAL